MLNDCENCALARELQEARFEILLRILYRPCPIDRGDPRDYYNVTGSIECG